jgi:hypothetical protein
MQSCSDLPPPPAVLAADSVGLLLEDDGEVKESVLAVPPAVRLVVVAGGGRGVMACNCGAGAPITDIGAGGRIAGAAGAVCIAFMLERGIAGVGGSAAAAPGGVDCGNVC